MPKRGTSQLVQLAWPIFAEQALHVMTGTIDVFMVGHVSDRAVAGLGVANQIVVLAIILFNFVAMGASVVATHSLGAGDAAGAREVGRTAIAASFWIGALISAAVLVFREPVLQLMHVPPDLTVYALPFLGIVGGTLWLESVNMAMSAVLRAHGHTRAPMLTTLGQNALNVVGNFILLFGLLGAPKLGVIGVAMSTVASRIVASVALYALLTAHTGISLALRDVFHISRERVGPILQIGLPAAGENFSWWVAFMTITSFSALMGGNALVVQSYTMQILQGVIVLSISVALATEIIVGHLIGAGRFDEAYDELMKSLRTSFLLAGAGIGCVAALAPYLLGIFTRDAAVIAGGAFLLRLSILLEPGRVLNIVVINTLRATGDTRYPIAVGILSMWGVWVPLAWLLGLRLGWGLPGVWLAMICDEWLRGILMYRRWRHRRWLPHAERVRARVSGGPAPQTARGIA